MAVTSASRKSRAHEKPLISCLSLPLHTAFQGSSALSWPCTSEYPDVFILFIPGNPGLSNYYIPYLSAIHGADRLRGKVEILSVSHRGHATLPLGARQDIVDEQEGTGLEAQVRQKIAAVEAIRNAYPTAHSLQIGEETKPVKLILIGHSVGAYIALKVLEHLGDQVDGVQLLFPTIIDIAKTPKGSSLQLQFITSPLVQSLVLPYSILLLSLLPSVVLLTLIKLVTGMSDAAISTGLPTTFEFVSTPGALLNAVRMASDEFRTIRQPSKGLLEAAQALKERGGSLRAYWSPGDEDSWAPSLSRQELELALSLTRVGLPPSTALPATKADTFGYAAAATAESSDFSFPQSSKASLSSRTLQIGGTLTRAAGCKLIGFRSNTNTQQQQRQSYEHETSTTRRTVAGGRSSAISLLEDLFSPVKGEDSQPSALRTVGGGGSPTRIMTSPTKERRRIIPLTPSSPSPCPCRGLDAETGIGSDPSTAAATSASLTGPLSSDNEMTRRRRLSMAHAKARRSIDGSITLKLPKGENWSLLADSAAAGALGSDAETKEDGDDGDEDEGNIEDDLGGKSASANRHGRNSQTPLVGPATSTVCKVGMPHAFCLKHGVDMGRISAYWIARDFL